MKVELSKLHRQLAPILFLPLLASAITGVLYQLGKSWFGISNWVGDVLMTIHQGGYLGQRLVPIYILLISLGVLGMSLTGLNMLDRQRDDTSAKQKKLSPRNIHRLLALILLLPLSISAETGVAYRLGRDWFGISEEKGEFLLLIHKGMYLGSTFSTLYVFLLGSGSIALLIAGIKMTSLVKRRSQQQPQPFSAQLLSQSALSNTIISLRRKAWLGIIISSIVFCSILYGVVSKILTEKNNASVAELETPSSASHIDLLIPIGIFGLVFGVVGLLVAEKLIQNWRRQKEIQAALYESEVTSSTILRALPDSMLRMKKDGTCISYMPAKESNSFAVHGDVLGKNVTEFLPRKIAQQMIEYAHLALKTGSTQVLQFQIPLDGQRQYQEARINSIGNQEFLVIIRALADPVTSD